jgi:hypothetical protein
MYTDALHETRKLPHRSRCDPLIYFTIAKNRCARLREGRQLVASAVRDVMDLRQRFFAARFPADAALPDSFARRLRHGSSS